MIAQVIVRVKPDPRFCPVHDRKLVVEKAGGSFTLKEFFADKKNPSWQSLSQYDAADVSEVRAVTTMNKRAKLLRSGIAYK